MQTLALPSVWPEYQFAGKHLHDTEPAVQLNRSPCLKSAGRPWSWEWQTDRDLHEDAAPEATERQAAVGDGETTQQGLRAATGWEHEPPMGVGAVKSCPARDTGARTATRPKGTGQIQ